MKVKSKKSKKKVPFWVLVVGNRIKSLKKNILVLGIIAVLSILVIEFFLNKIPAPNRFINSLGIIYLKLCYSYFSAFIFYVLVIHLPRENRKVKAFRMLSNKVSSIHLHFEQLLQGLFIKHDPNFNYNTLNKETLKKYCQQTKMYEPVVVYPEGHVNSAMEYIKYKTQKIKNLIDSIIQLNDVVDNDLLQSLTHIDDVIVLFIWWENANLKNNRDLGIMDTGFRELIIEIQELMNIMTKNYSRYSFEYHNAYRKTTQKYKELRLR